MPKICYVEHRFSAERMAVITKANEILEDYAKQGYELTLRQLYYQFVARALIPNKDAEYKKLGETINDARLAGLIDWDHIEDRTRNLEELSHWKSPSHIVEVCAEQYREDLWASQHNYVEVWVEKDALSGVLKTACEPEDVPYFSCRGYVSQSEMWAAAVRLVKQIQKGKKVTILHLGDHDPSGVDMTRDIRDRLNLFARRHTRGEVIVDRIALTMDQIREYNPPPNPAKVTDARAAAYIAEYGNESWELDALEPAVLTRLIKGHIGVLRDEEAWGEAQAHQEEGREGLTAVSEHWGGIVAALRDRPDLFEE